MRFLTLFLAVVGAMGACARLLPASLCALPYVPDVVALTPWFAVPALASLALTFVPARRRSRGLRLLARALAIACLALEVAWQAPFFVPSARVVAARETLVETDGTEGNSGDGTSAGAGTSKGSSSGDEPDAGASGAAAATGSEDAGKSGAPEADAAATTSALTVMTCNVYKGAADAEGLVGLVRERGVQVLALQETTAEFVERLEAAGIDELLPYSERSSSDGVYGNGVWSAYPLADGASDDIGSSASAMPAGTVALTLADGSTARVRFVSVHTCSPTAGYWGLWKKSIDEIGVVRERLAADASTSYVLMGDFNATYDHAPFRKLLGQGSDAELHDATRECGQGLVGTWPADKAVPFAGIDHVVTSERVVATSVAAAKVEGTDHLALIATLALS